MAEGRHCDILEDVKSSSGNSEDAVQFKDPLLTGLDRESDEDDGVSICTDINMDVTFLYMFLPYHKLSI